MHNQLLGAVLRGPLGRLDFDERTRLVHELVLQARDQPWAGLIDEAAAGAARMPGAVPLMASALASLDVVASNVVGPPAPMWLAGVPVSSMTPVGPRSGAAVNATLLSYGNAAAIGLNLDPAAVGDPGVLVDCLAAAFEEATEPTTDT
jgi:diacylglycerol O-acyltransferase / wax synthase